MRMAESIIRAGVRETCRLHYDSGNREMAYFTFDGLEQTGIVEHFFTTRYGGVSSGHLFSLNFSYSQGDITENVDENFEIKLKSIVGVIETGLFIGYNIEIVN